MLPSGLEPGLAASNHRQCWGILVLIAALQVSVVGCRRLTHAGVTGGAW